MAVIVGACLVGAVALQATRDGGVAATCVCCLAAAVLACALGGRAWAGLQLPRDDAGPVDGWAVLVADPIRVPGGAYADVRMKRHHLRATMRGEGSDGLATRDAGQRIFIRATLRPLEPQHRVRLASRHLAGRLDVHGVERVDQGNAVSRAANAFRRCLLRGAEGFSPARRALFAGIVIGDDRGQDPAEVEDFRGSGLTHLLAVSGQNVAFALTLVGPGLALLGLRARLIAAIAFLLLFGAVTRWEPSVLRAVTMAGIAVFASVVGRPASATRVLALAVVALLLVDPLLVRSVGFQLSVGASAGIVWLGPRLAARMPEPLAVTLAAQLGVAPILVPTFGGLPLVSIPANLLAVPAAGPLMMWGLAAGVPAGLVGGRLAAVVHLPTRVLLAWVSGVARIAASAPLGAMTRAVVLTGGAAWLATALLAHHPRIAPACAMGVALCVALAPAVHPADANDRVLDTGGKDRLWRRGPHAVVVTDGSAPPGRLLGALRAEQVRMVDVLVVTGRARAVGAAVGAATSRIPVRLVLAPVDRQYGTSGVRVVGLREGIYVRAGPISVEVVGPREARVQVGSPGAADARPP